MWPIVLETEVNQFATTNNLEDFETFIHEKQVVDLYYAKPRLLQKENGVFGAVYVLTEECESIFPIKADRFLNLSEVKVEEGFIQFYIFSENRMGDGLFEYDKFITYMINKGVKKYDDTHVILPSISKEEFREIVNNI